ncbi:MAG: autotransporter outer membrane beta-barrel domain-containing protein [Methylobacter sp.]
MKQKVDMQPQVKNPPFISRKPGIGIHALALLVCSTTNVYAAGTATPIDIPGLIILDANVSADHVNTVTVGATGNPPFEPGTSVYKVQTTQPFIGIRSYYIPTDANKAGQAGGWISPIAETRGLSRAMLLDRLALPIYTDGTRNNTFALALVPAGVTFWSGPAGAITSSTVAPVGAYWGAGGGIQYYVGRNAGDVSGFQVPIRNYVLAAPMGENNLLAYSPRLTGNALKVGSYMDGLSVQAYSDLDKVLTSLDLINLSAPAGDQKLQQAISQMGAERLGALGRAGLYQSRLFMNQLTAASSTFSPDSRVVSATDDKERRTWIHAQGTWARQSSDSDRTGFSQNTAMVVAGIETNQQEHWNFGAAAGYLSSDLDWAESSPGQAKLDSGYLGGYGSYRADALIATGQLFLGYSGIDTRRNINIPDAGLWPGYSFAVNRNADGSSHALSSGARVDVARAFSLEKIARAISLQKVKLTPFVGLEYQRFDRGRFTEQGAGGLDLAVQSKTLDDLRARVGVSLAVALGKAASLDWSVDGSVLTSPRLWSNTGTLTAGFDGQTTTFQSGSWRSPADLTQLGFGFSGRRNNAELALMYNYERGSGLEASAVIANGAWRF